MHSFRYTTIYWYLEYLLGLAIKLKRDSAQHAMLLVRIATRQPTGGMAYGNSAFASAVAPQRRQRRPKRSRGSHSGSGSVRAFAAMRAARLRQGRCGLRLAESIRTLSLGWRIERSRADRNRSAAAVRAPSGSARDDRAVKARRPR
jgi:hypothetical protein